MTFLAALRHDRIEAPWFIEGPIDGDSFRLYVEKILLPTLRPGDIVVMDNLGSHRGKVVRQLIRSTGAGHRSIGLRWETEKSSKVAKCFEPRLP
jgi:transposase